MVHYILPWVAVGACLGRVMARSCVVFDSSWNLHVLAPSADYKLGAQDSWSSGASAQALTAGGLRPPFDGDRPRCHLAQSHNTVYALGIDKSNPGDVWIYNFPSNSWSKQAMSTGDTPDPENMWEVLDHDTGVVYAYSKGTMYFARFEEQTAATSSANAWTNQGLSFQFPPDGYKATVVNANNRVHFFGAPGLQPGQSYLYVVHYAYPQPEAQLYPSTTGDATFPVSHGWATSIFDAANKEQRQVAFIPDNMAATYIVDSKTNQTLPMAPPTVKDLGSHFAGSTSAVVQLTSDGKVFFLPVTQTDIAGTGANRGAAWKQIATVNVNESGSGIGGGNGNGGSSATTTGSGSSPTKGSTGTGSGASSGSNSGSNNSTSTGNAPDDAAGHLASVSWVAALVALVSYAL